MVKYILKYIQSLQSLKELFIDYVHHLKIGNLFFTLNKKRWWILMGLFHRISWFIQGVSYWSMQSKSALRGRRINDFIELWCLMASGVLGICVSSLSFQKNYSLISLINLLILMVWSSLAPNWPMPVPFCGIDHQKSNFSPISDTLSQCL